MTEHDFQQHVIEAIAALQQQQAKVIESLAIVKTHMKELVGNGQPGRIQRQESIIDSLKMDVADLQRSRAYYLGITGAISAIVGFIASLLASFYHFLK